MADGHAGTRPGEILERARSIARALAPSAAERERRGGTPLEERRLLRESGLLGISVPRALGGGGASFATVLEAVRILARVDGSLAHVFSYHHLLLTTLALFGTPSQYERWAVGTLRERWLWGNALNPRDLRARGVRRADGSVVVRGEKSFASGSIDADVLVVSFLEDPGDTLRVAVLRGATPGIAPRADWDAFGQRQTDSGTVALRDVAVPADALLLSPGPLGSVRASLRPLLAQLSLVAIYVGLAEGALEAAVAASRERGAPDDAARALAGELFADDEASAALLARAASQLDDALAAGDALRAEERARLALTIAAAKSVATRHGLTVASRAIELAGARATERSRGLDRFWRDLRVHTLHDPIARKHHDLGRWVLEGEPPTPSFYS